MIIAIEIPGIPVAKARPRSKIITPKSGKSPFVTHYTPKKTSNFENKVAYGFRKKYCGPPTEGPCAIEIKMYFPIPKAWPKYKKKEALEKPVPVIKRPDIDNLIKSILDGLNSVAYLDDNQVYKIECSKWYGIEPRTEIYIDFINNEQGGQSNDYSRKTYEAYEGQ